MSAQKIYSDIRELTAYLDKHIFYAPDDFRFVQDARILMKTGSDLKLQELFNTWIKFLIVSYDRTFFEDHDKIIKSDDRNLNGKEFILRVINRDYPHLAPTTDASK